MKKGHDEKVVDFAARRAVANCDGSFIDLLDKDMKSHDEAVVAIPGSLIDRMETLRAKARDSERREAMGSERPDNPPTPPVRSESGGSYRPYA
jgi:hypothetical protein